MSMSVGPCLAYRLGTAKAAKLGVEGKRDCVESLCRKRRAPGVLAYDGDEVVGWAAIAPRDELAEFAGDDPFPRVDDAEVWSLFCLRARAGRRKQGVGTFLIDGAVDFAGRHGATIVEAYPLDTDEKVLTTGHDRRNDRPGPACVTGSGRGRCRGGHSRRSGRPSRTCRTRARGVRRTRVRDRRRRARGCGVRRTSRPARRR